MHTINITQLTSRYTQLKCAMIAAHEVSAARKLIDVAEKSNNTISNRLRYIFKYWFNTSLFRNGYLKTKEMKFWITYHIALLLQK